ncbi:hypothetical protein R3P38DRAFT_2644879 [Favolaschia claudopus]|uniref:Protein kinase domain-containing protein n=1 Tax=Favolaschia claudopus TaxID=2862362 RepID=A0AAW0AFI8_9AGAR
MHPEEPYDTLERRQIVRDPRQSTRQDWLAGTILTLKTIAATAEIAPLPYIRAALGTVVILLETVEKMKKNRDDLLDLCASIVEIILLVKDEVSCHGEAGGTRLAGLCEEFISLLRALHTGLEHLTRRRAGIKGWLYESLRVESVADQIQRYRYRINELVATLNSNLHIATIQKTVTDVEDVCSPKSEFRRIALGDVNLLHEIARLGKANAVKVFTARITGQSALMTVAQYEADTARWQSDLEEYSRIRHPNIWQLFGFVSSPGLSALIFHDELIPLEIYRKYHRPKSDMVWACIEGMLFQQFRNCSPYHYWRLGSEESEKLTATICVRRQPVQLCLAMPGMTRLHTEEKDLDTGLSSWHTTLFEHHLLVENSHLTSALEEFTSSPSMSPVLFSRLIEWRQMFSALIPVRFPIRIDFNMQETVFLGSVVGHGGRVHATPIAYIPSSFGYTFSTKDWQLQPPPGVHFRDGDDALSRFTFLPGSFKRVEYPEFQLFLKWSLEMQTSEYEHSTTSWLSQANLCTGDGGRFKGCDGRFRCGIIDALSCALMLDEKCRHLLRDEGTLREAHIFLCTPRIRRKGSRVGIEFPEADQFYWSLDLTGSSPLTEAECDSIGLPRLRFLFMVTARFWHEYQYYALREFFIIKGMDPCSQEVTRMLGLPLAELESRVSAVDSICRLT